MARSSDSCTDPDVHKHTLTRWNQIEHKAIGLQASFAFVLFYYAESTGSFSMTGRDGTALRSLAAVAQAMSVLSGATCVHPRCPLAVDASHTLAHVRCVAHDMWETCE